MKTLDHKAKTKLGNSEVQEVFSSHMWRLVSSEYQHIEQLPKLMLIRKNTVGRSAHIAWMACPSAFEQLVSVIYQLLTPMANGSELLLVHSSLLTLSGNCFSSTTVWKRLNMTAEIYITEVVDTADISDALFEILSFFLPSLPRISSPIWAVNRAGSLTGT